MKIHNNFDERFVFDGKLKSGSIAAIVIGLVVILAGLFVDTQRVFSNLLINSYYFVCVCLASAVFLAIQYVAQAGWSASFIRIPQAVVKVLPIAIAVMVIVVVAGLLTHHTVTIEDHTATGPYLYHSWATKGLMTPGNELYDKELAGKGGYLNQGFFLARVVGFLAVYCLFAFALVKYSFKEDEIGGMENYKKSFKLSAAFLAIFGFTFPLFAFDSMMSLEAHYFSTMFGWYNFAGMWVSGISVLALVTVTMKKRGYLGWINESHFHNLGLFMFAFSIFWTYTWFAQFLLTYYANIPEESAYFYKRWEPQFKPWFWLAVVLNFCAPLLVVMKRDSKRVMSVIQWISIILIIGHWVDYFNMVMPGTVGVTSHWYTEVLWIEVGTFIGFAGLASFTIFSSISKVTSLVPKNHPFLEESLHHHI